MKPASLFALALLAAFSALTPAARADNPLPSGDTLFDGSKTRHDPFLAAPQGGAARNAAPRALRPATVVPDQQLFSSLMDQVTFRQGQTPQEVGLLMEAFQQMLTSRTGSELIASFVREHARATVGFGKVEGSTVVEEDGLKTLSASGGFTQTTHDPPDVTLNQDYLKTSPEYRRVEIARVLTHEMMGHGFQRQRILAAGLSPEAMYYYRGDEGNASMVGWLVQAELGGKLINAHMWNWLTDPEKFYDHIQYLSPYYATTLNAQQMQDPIATWNARLGKLGAQRAALAGEEKDERRWRAVMQHFITDHGMDASRFSNLRNESDATLSTYYPSQRRNLDEVQTQLRDALAKASGPGGAKLLADMRAAGQSAYVADLERRMNEYTERLRSEVGTRKPETAAPPDPNQVTWQDLAGMFQRDDPAHVARLKAQFP